MRPLLIPKYERFDFNQPLEEMENKSATEVIENISSKFDEYLKNLNIRATSKHSLMGPVGKILQQIKAGKLDIEFLKGYGIRIHKSDPRITSHLNTAALKSFEDGIENISNLLLLIPRHLRPRVVELIDYKVYYRREKANVEFLEKWRKEFEDFLEKKYKDVETLIEKCKLEEVAKKVKIKEFQDIVGLPKRLRTPELQTVVDEFNKSRKEIILEEEEVEE